MPFQIVRQDITKMKVDAIVNAANPELQMGGGVCGAIFNAAGPEELQAACNKLAPIKTGEAVITPGFDLPAKFIIHAVGPIYIDGKMNEAEKLRAAYTNSLKRAVENHCESIAFPLISSGIYGYPPAEALQVAQTAILEFLENEDLDIYLAVFNKDAFDYSTRLMGEVAAYIDQHYVDEQLSDLRQLRREETEQIRKLRSEHALQELAPYAAAPSLNDRIKTLDEPFSDLLFRLISEKNMTDPEVYKRANLDRKLFSKIRTSKTYAPGKKTVLALAIGLKLTLPESKALLERAGFALSSSNLFDVIVEFFIVNGIYNIFTINEALFMHDQELLGM